LWGPKSVLAFLVLCCLTSCAKTGDPQPPLVRISKAAVDLEVRQVADAIIISVTPPSENTDGSPARDLDEVEVLRMPAQTGNPGISRGERVIAVAGDQQKNYLVNGTLVFSDPLVSSDHKAVFGAEARYAVRFFNRKHQTAGLSNQAAIVPVSLPAPPRGLAVEVSQDNIRVQWLAPSENSDGSKPANLLGYNIYRAANPQEFPAAPVNRELLLKPEFEDHEFEFDRTYYYRVVAVGRLQRPSAETSPSVALSVTPRDIFPPLQPQNLNLVVDNGTIVLLWAASASPDVSGYRVYRQEEGMSDWLLLQQTLITQLVFRDEKVLAGKKYVYRVTAVDAHGNEGASAQSTVEVR
jgi:hypothetical protein